MGSRCGEPLLSATSLFGEEQSPHGGPGRRLARFLSERTQFPGFKDEVRGWVIRWKEYTHRGTVRGCGQFYERLYAWLDA